MPELKLDDLAELLDRLTFLNGPHGSFQEWQHLEISLGKALACYDLALFYNDAEKCYMVRSDAKVRDEMKQARLLIKSILLVCPECQQTVTTSKGEQVLRADDPGIAERWAHVKKHGLTCPHCNAVFTLPTNPFDGKWK